MERGNEVLRGFVLAILMYIVWETEDPEDIRISMTRKEDKEDK